MKSPHPPPSPSHTPDGELVAATRRGDQPAFGTLVERHKAAVWAMCHRYLGPADAADAAQETFFRAHQALATFDAALAFRPWLLKIARNHCLDELRRRGRRPEALTTAGDGHDQLAGIATERTAPDAALSAKEETQRVKAALALIPERHREAVLLFHEAQLSYAEIAKVLGVPIGTVMTWIYRARQQLKLTLEAAS